jgi:hypothetical protein
MTFTIVCQVLLAIFRTELIERASVAAIRKLKSEKASSAR